MTFSTRSWTIWYLSLFLNLVAVGKSADPVGSNVYLNHAFVSAFPTNESDRMWLLDVADKGGRCELLMAPRIDTGRTTDFFCAEPKFMEDQLRLRGVQNTIDWADASGRVKISPSTKVYQVGDFKSYAR
jgi:hypothetical protein